MICGHWLWEAEHVEHLHLDYDVCQICQPIGQFRQRLSGERDDMYGVSVAFHATPREESNGDRTAHRQAAP